MNEITLGPAISVLVVNWNRKNLLRECLRSLARQADADFEVILVDNGSQDGSADMAESEFGRTGMLDLRILRNKENRGFCAANNQGIALSRGVLIALLNNDADAAPGWLRALANAFEGRPEIGMSYARQMLDTYSRTFNVDADVLAAAIDALSDCVQACNADNAADLSEPNVTEMVTCIRLCLDCVDICAATEGVISRQTDYDANVVRPLLEACVATCKSCGDEC